MVQDGAFRIFSPSFLSQSQLGEIQAGLWRLKQPQKIINHPPAITSNHHFYWLYMDVYGVIHHFQMGVLSTLLFLDM